MGIASPVEILASIIYERMRVKHLLREWWRDKQEVRDRRDSGR